jgi:hypothetical protein
LIHRKRRETFGIADYTKDIMLIVFQPEHIVLDGDHTRSRASLTMEDISHASWDDAEEKEKP